jgi:BON domain-containing protein
MKRLIPLVAIIVLAGAAATGCDRAKTTAYNNSGTSATPGSSTTTTTTTSPSSSTTTPSDATSSSSTPASSSDTSSANTASTSSTSSSSNPSGANAVTDTVTTGKVKAAFASENGLKDSDLNVTTEGGVVKLSGTVKSQDQISLAQNVAQRQEGVTKVDAASVTVK